MSRDAPDEVFEALKAREPVFHRLEHGTGRGDFERMTDDGFWEVGASGRVYDRRFVLAELERRYSEGVPDDEWEIEQCRCETVADDLYLFSYRLLQGKRATRRASLWRRAGDAWKIVYHQGTPIAD